MAEHLPKGVERGMDTSVREAAFFDPEFISMYELPGEKLGPQDVERYVYSTNVLLVRVGQAVETILGDGTDLWPHTDVPAIARDLPDMERLMLVEKIREHIRSTLSTHELFYEGDRLAQEIRQLLAVLKPEERLDIPELLEKSVWEIFEKDGHVTFGMVYLLPALPLDTQELLGQKILLRSEEWIVNAFFHTFPSLDPSIQVALYERAIDVAYDHQVIELVSCLSLIPEQDRSRYIQRLKARPMIVPLRLDLDLVLIPFGVTPHARETITEAVIFHDDQRRKGIEVIPNLPEQDRKVLLRIFLERGDLEPTTAIIGLFATDFSSEERIDLVTDIFVREEGDKPCSRLLKLIFASSQAIQVELHKPVSAFFDTVVARGSMWYKLALIPHLKKMPFHERGTWVIPLLTDINANIQMEAARCIKELPLLDQHRAHGVLFTHLQELLAEDDPFSWRRAFERIHFLPEVQQQDIKDRFPAQLEREAAPTQRLYRKVSSGFIRKPFDKTGSGLTLLGKVPFQEDEAWTLQERVILHRLGVRQYLAWKKAFEAADIWHRKGFDYVPIEPIASVLFTRSQPFQTRVFSRVLGPSVTQWRDAPGVFMADISRQMDLIIEVLAEIGVSHGHPHGDNFCIVPMRTAAGEIDLFQPPRVYLIDFDMASIVPRPLE